ncbi:MAG: hypothetical protein RLZZ09_2336 [Pseudomonadota bacterium]|jgi:hypothetical protein
MDSYDGHLYKGQGATRRLLATIEQAVKDNDAPLVLACAAELIDLLGDAYFFHDGGRTAQVEISDFLRSLRNDQAVTESEEDKVVSAKIATALNESSDVTQPIKNS